ncbi:MAG TPA: hypothetical protein VFW34_02920 [Candidatus Rubrimentiphilum sp.]|nr:hypothetical protein [Candidatus Rubrimentiphilum sp.]
MTLETLSTAAAVGTFLVIAATAAAALVQLRHLRVSNQLEALLAILSLPYEPILSDSIQFVSHELEARMRDPEFRRELEKPLPDRKVHKELQVCDYYERLGSIVKNGLIPEELYFDNSTPEQSWRLLSQVIAIRRRVRGPVVYDNFEYLVARSRAYDRRHPNGNYPASEPRVEIEDVWLADDRRLSGADDECPIFERNVSS